MPSPLFRELYYKSAVSECARLCSLSSLLVEFKTADYTSLVSLADSLYRVGADFVDTTTKHAALLNPRKRIPTVVCPRCGDPYCSRAGMYQFVPLAFLAIGPKIGK